jgi:hypothetical protein
MNSDSLELPSYLRPRIVADHCRAIEVHEALGRSLAAGGLQSVPVAWAEELFDIVSRHQPKG